MSSVGKLQDDDDENINGRVPSSVETHKPNVNHDSDLDLTADQTAPTTIAPPIDKYKLVCIRFAILGIATLLPWNFLITADDYWGYKFRNVTHPTADKTQLQTFFESDLAIASNFTTLVAMLINSFYGQRFAQKFRLYASLYVMLIIFSLTTFLVEINTDEIQTLFFYTTILMVIMVSFFAAIFQSAMFGLVASFPSHCMHAMSSGQAVAGLLAVAVQILSMLGATKPTTSGFLYFSASTLFLIFAIYCYWSMNNEYTNFYLKTTTISSSEDNNDQVSIMGETVTNKPNHASFIADKMQVLECIKESWQISLSILLVFLGSLSVFPAICILVKPQHPNSSLLTGRFFTVLATFLVFNCADLTGRLVSAYIKFPKRQKSLLLLVTCLRMIIPILVLFCNVDRPRLHTTVWFTNDLSYSSIVAILGLTNGYLFSTAMEMGATNSLSNQIELTGFIMATALGIGLTVGSLLSSLLLKLI